MEWALRARVKVEVSSRYNGPPLFDDERGECPVDETNIDPSLKERSRGFMLECKLVKDGTGKRLRSDAETSDWIMSLYRYVSEAVGNKHRRGTYTSCPDDCHLVAQKVRNVQYQT